MLVSVVMSVWNAEEFVAEAISSILRQTYGAFEFIIVNDGSTDKSLEVIRTFDDPRIILIDQYPNRGLSKSLNKGISVAKGKFIARIDADDVSDPERLEKQIAYFSHHPECILVGSQAKLVDKLGNYLYTSRNPRTHKEILEKLPDASFFHSSVMFSKDAFLRCGGYEETIIHHFEDKLLWNKMAQIGTVHNLDDALISYRLLPFSISNNDPRTNKQVKKIADKLIVTGSISNEELSRLKKLTSLKKRKRLGNYYRTLGIIYVKENFNRSKAIKNLCLSLLFEPAHFSVYSYMLLCLLPKDIRLWLK